MSLFSNNPAVHGHRTAYHYYVQACRKEFETAHPNETPDFIEFIQNCQAKWSGMSDLEKVEFQELADADKIRYNNELLQHGNPLPTEKAQQRRKRKVYEDPRPKQPLSPFYWFCNDVRSVVMDEQPGFDQGQVAVELGRRWINASLEIKQKYEKIADEELIKYEVETGSSKKAIQ